MTNQPGTGVLSPSEHATDSLVNKGVVCPWEENPRRTVSLLDMLRLYADFFVQAVCEMYECEAKWHPNDGYIPGPSAVAGKLSSLQAMLMEHGLLNTAQKCGRVMYKCQTERVTFREAVADLKDIRERLEDELRAECFMHLSPSEAMAYNLPLKDWDQVITRFPKVRHDIEESSKCVAFGRYAAAVFHALLVAEYGIVELCRVLLPGEKKPGWNALERLERITLKKPQDRTPLETKHLDLLRSTAPLAHAIKDSWRHKITHVDNKLQWDDTDFGPEVTDEIIKATRGFMRRLASDLPQSS